MYIAAAARHGPSFAMQAKNSGGVMLLVNIFVFMSIHGLVILVV